MSPILTYARILESHNPGDLAEARDRSGVFDGQDIMDGDAHGGFLLLQNSVVGHQ